LENLKSGLSAKTKVQKVFSVQYFQ